MRFPDSKFFRVIAILGDLIYLSMLWLVCSLPVVTLGASSAALYYSAVKRQGTGGSSPVKTFFHSFRDNLAQGTAVTLLTAAGVFAAALAGPAVTRMLSGDGTVPAVHFTYLVLSLFAVTWLQYLVSYIARFRAPLGTVLRNTLLILLMNMPVSVSLMLAFVVLAAVCIAAFPYSLSLLLLLPGVYAWGSSFLLERTYQKYVNQENEEHENP